MLESIASRVLKTNDYAKLYLWCPKVQLSAILVWPEMENDFKKFASFFINSITVVFLVWGLALCIKEHTDNFNRMSYAMCIITLVSMGLSKTLFQWFKTKELKQLVVSVMTQFWPYDLIDGHSKRALIKYFNYTNIMFVALFFVGAQLYSLLLEAVPLFLTERTLPFDVEYPFDWTKSPIYEGLYFIQVYTLAISVAVSLSGIDMLIHGLLVSAAAQYCILRECFYIFNTPKMYVVNKRMRQICCDGLETKYDETKEYFVRCIKHHQFLLRFTKQLNSVFNLHEFCQLAFSCIAICLGTIRLTSKENLTFLQRVVSCFYMLGVTAQLGFDCILGTFLHSQASNLPETIFHSNWLNLESKLLKKDVQFLMQHSQRIPQFSAYGLYDMHMMSYVKVLKLAFSLYTFLKQIQ